MIARDDTLTHPQLFLSSEEAGWDGLILRAFYEPMEMDDWLVTDVSDDIVLVLFTHGTMHMERRFINAPWKGIHINQGDLSLNTVGAVPYEVRWQGLSHEPMQTLHIHLSKDLLARTAEELTGHDRTQFSLAGRMGFQDPLLAQVALALYQELAQHGPAGKLYAQTAAQMLAVHLLRHYTSTHMEIQDPAQRLTGQQVKRVTDFILAHLNQDLSLEVLSQQIGFSSYHFAHLFRQTTGKSPHQWVMQQRVERALHLLKETDTPLAHIALESGFANQSHLTQVFKRHLNLTPRAYRQGRKISARF